MKRALVLNAFSIAVAFAAQSSYALDDKSYTYGDAALTNVISSGAQAGIAFALGQYGNFVTTQLVDRPGMPTPLTDADIEKVVARINRSPLAQFGLGTVGGSHLEVEYDQAQRTRMLGVKNGAAVLSAYSSKQPGVKTEGHLGVNVTETPGGVNADQGALKAAEATPSEFVTEKWNVRTMGGAENIKAQLVELKNAGASVRTLTFRGFVPRVGGFAVGTLQVILVGGTVGNGANALVYSMHNDRRDDSWVQQRCPAVRLASGETKLSKDQCAKAGIAEAWLDTSEYMFYKFTPDEK